MYDYIKIPEIIDDKKFENLILDLYKRIYDRVQKNGREGQKQNGVDVFGYNNGELVGIQCKVKSKADFKDRKFKNCFIREIKEEVEKAKCFSNKLSLFIVMTTAPRDTDIQRLVIELDNFAYKNYGFNVGVKFWDDISYMLTEEVHKNTFKKYYGNLMIQEEIVGLVKSKVLSLVVGVEDRDDSLYQLILGYIPKLNRYPNGIEYYSNSYFLGCFQSRGVDTFPIRCFPSDIECVITDNMSYRDRCTIVDWLNSIDLDKEISNDIREYRYYWTKDRFEEYLESIQD